MTREDIRIITGEALRLYCGTIYIALQRARSKDTTARNLEYIQDKEGITVDITDQKIILILICNK